LPTPVAKHSNTEAAATAAVKKVAKKPPPKQEIAMLKNAARSPAQLAAAAHRKAMKASAANFPKPRMPDPPVKSVVVMAKPVMAKPIAEQVVPESPIAEHLKVCNGTYDFVRAAADACEIINGTLAATPIDELRSRDVEELSLPLLQGVMGTIRVYHNSKLKRIHLPKLIAAQHMLVYNNARLEEVNTPKLSFGLLHVWDHAQLGKVNLPTTVYQRFATQCAIERTAMRRMTAQGFGCYIWKNNGNAEQPFKCNVQAKDVKKVERSVHDDHMSAAAELSLHNNMFQEAERVARKALLAK